MSRIENQIYIELPPPRVYEYVTTPAKWPEWHPSSVRLDASAGHPLTAGARFEEDIRAAKRDGHLSWTVCDSRASKSWTAEAVGLAGLGRLRLRYDFEPRGNGTRFTRTLDYEMAGLWQTILNQLVLKRRIAQESAHSLSNLKRVIETAARSRG